MLLLLKSEKAEQIAKALIGFSLLFVAIEWMSESITTS
jgi:Na+/phosphate symporter